MYIKKNAKRKMFDALFLKAKEKITYMFINRGKSK